ncbi:MAG: DJ-1/PfpI family protein [Ignavibacteriales bacterium]|nr:DJ-1/PfpI family protein [Ignavibacteriales bacterium]
MTKIISVFVTLLILIGVFNFNYSKEREKMKKDVNPILPTIGIVIFDGVLTNEVTAPLDVFTKSDSRGKKLFNVVLLSKEEKVYITEEGLRILPDYTFAESPKLNVIVVPSSMSPQIQTSDSTLVNFIKVKSKSADYTASHCAGAFLLGEAGIANNKKIVTYCAGGESLQQKYPSLLVMDDSKNSVVRDGNIISSNGNLVSYIASLDLLELMTSKAQREYVENELLLNKLKGNLK